MAAVRDVLSNENQQTVLVEAGHGAALARKAIEAKSCKLA